MLEHPLDSERGRHSRDESFRQAHHTVQGLGLVQEEVQEGALVVVGELEGARRVHGRVLPELGPLNQCCGR